MTYNAKDYDSREALENAIVSALGATPDTKDAVITGTGKELLKLTLSHGQRVWGVPVEATNYKVNNYPRVERGGVVPSKLNGRDI